MHYKAQSIEWRSLVEDESSNEYWKVGASRYLNNERLRSALQEGKFYFPHNSRRDGLLEQFHRMRRGLLCYENCSSVELEKFVADRGIDLAPLDLGAKKIPWVARKKDLVASLKTADDTSTFNRFADLPPELRSRVYKMHFEDLDLPLCPAQPPVTKVSRMVRNEALPLFYSCSTFPLKVRICATTADRKRCTSQSAFRLGGGCHAHLHEDTAEFFEKAEEDGIDRIKTINVRLGRSGRRGLGWNLKLGELHSQQEGVELDASTLDLSRRNKQRYRFGPERVEDDDLEELLGCVTEALEQAVAVINSRTSKGKLRRHDASLIDETVRTAAPEVLAGWCRP